MYSIPRIIEISADNSHSAGIKLGRALGEDFVHYVNLYIKRRTASNKDFSLPTCTQHAVPWIESLPTHFKERLLGLSDGSGVAYEVMAVWAYLEVLLNQGCSTILCRANGKTWTAHNNDSFVPELWGYVTTLNIKGRIGSMNLGLAGDIWTTAGVNESRLWLHVDYLPATDRPDSAKVALPTYGFLVEALETCENVIDIEHLLEEINRYEGMILVVVDGKVDEAVIFECTCSGWNKAPFDSDWIVRTNHALIGQQSVSEPRKRPLDSRSRFTRLNELLRAHYDSNSTLQDSTLQCFLADEQVERRGKEFATAYSVIACPADRVIQFTFGGVPAASQGKWRDLKWPW